MSDDLAARDAAALLLGLAGLLEGRGLDQAAVHPDLQRSSVSRLRTVATGLARAHGHHDLLKPASPPAEGTAWATQLALLLHHSSPPVAAPVDDTAATGSMVNDSPAATTRALDQSGIESFPASDPPSP